MVVAWNAANGRLDGITPERRVQVFVEEVVELCFGSEVLRLGVDAGHTEGDEKREEDSTMSNHVRMSGFVELRDANGNGELLRGINCKLSHHGPDAEGYYEQGPARAGTSKSC